MKNIGLNVETETIEKLKVISFMTQKNRTELIKEGIVMIIEKYSKSFDEFQDYIEKIKKNK